MEQITTLWPEWRIVEKIGQGTYGAVYKIEKHDMLGTDFAALKVISLPRSEDDLYLMRHSGMDDQTVSRTLQKQVGSILQEYKLMRTLRDVPGVVHCDNYGYVSHTDGMGWDIHIQMELLTPFLRQKELIREEADIIRFGIELCQTLEACHAHGIIHRDIKPHNIFVTDDGRYKLGDFGIARFSDGTATATMGAGTLSFMAPEVFSGKRYNHTVDLYSLGMVMYWLLNDRKCPFQDGRRSQEEANGIRFSGVVSIPAPRNGSEALKCLVLKACAHEPGDRYTTAAAMRQALQEIKPDAHAPIPVAPAPAPMSLPITEDEAEELTLGIFNTSRPGKETPAAPPIPESMPQAEPEPPRNTPPVRRRRSSKHRLTKKQQWLYLFACFGVFMILYTYFFVHNWNEATCTDPRICSICKRISGDPHGHSWNQADCLTPRTCVLCDATEGDALGHDWLEATKEAPKICSRCSLTEGDSLPPSLIGSYYRIFNDAAIADHSHETSTNSIYIIFTEAHYLSDALNSLSITDIYGNAHDPSLYRVEIENKTLRVFFLDGTAPGIYRITTPQIQLTPIYGWHGEHYQHSTTTKLYHCSAQNLKNGRHLAVRTDDSGTVLTTFVEAEEATAFQDMEYACDIIEENGEATMVTARGYTLSNGAWYSYTYADSFISAYHYMRKADKTYIEANTLIFEGYYLASDEEGNVYITKELTDECYWIITQH